MLMEFATKALLVVYGYAMPAFECFKMVERHPGNVEQLRFWCQYWIIVGFVLATECLLSWLPAYEEVKLVFLVYLWYPKTKGSDVVYDTFVRPVVMQYEPNIEQRLLQLRARSGQLISFYFKNFTDKGTAFFLEIVRNVVSDKSETAGNERGRRQGWSPFPIRRQPQPQPPPSDESILDEWNEDAAKLVDTFRVAAARGGAGGTKPRKPHSNSR